MLVDILKSQTLNKANYLLVSLWNGIQSYFGQSDETGPCTHNYQCNFAQMNELKDYFSWGGAVTQFMWHI